MITHRKNLRVAIVFLLFSAVVLYYTNFHIIIPKANLHSVNSRSLPNSMAGGIFLLSLILALRSLFSAKKEKPAPADPAARNNKKTVASFIIVFALYAACMAWLGFFTSTSVFLVSVLFAFKVRWAIVIPVVVLTDVLLYLIFVTVMMVPLPTGWLI